MEHPPTSPTFPNKATAKLPSSTTAVTNHNLDVLGLLPHKAQKAFPLLDLPVELVKRTAFYLARPRSHFSLSKPRRRFIERDDDAGAHLLLHDDFLHFRLTCIWINEATFDLFRQTYFSSRVVKLQFESLHDLVQIAEHPRLGKQMQDLKVFPMFQSFRERVKFSSLESDYRTIAQEADYDPVEWLQMKDSFDKLAEAFHAAYQNDKRMRDSGLGPALLGRALSRFRRLRSIEYGLYRDDIQNPKLHRLNWRIAKLWEAAHIEEVVGQSLEEFCDVQFLFDWDTARVDGLDIVITAIIGSKVSLSSLRLEDGSLLLGSSMRRPPSEVSLLQECLQRLNSLHLSFGTLHPDHKDYNDGPSIDDALHFLSAVPQTLKELEISFEIIPEEFDGSDDNEKVNIATPLCNQLFSKISFPQLESLRIKCSSHATTGISQLVSHHAGSLKAVKIDHTVPRKGHPNYEIWTSLWGDSDFEFANAKWSNVLEACIQCDNLVNVDIHAQSDIYPETRVQRATHSESIRSSLIRWFGSEGVGRNGRLTYHCTAKLYEYLAEPPVQPRVDYVKNRLKQHLHEWRAAELAHGV